jgi:hypothetical protein
MRDLKGESNGQGLKEEGEAMAVEAWQRKIGMAASVRLEEEEGQSGHVG